MFEDLRTFLAKHPERHLRLLLDGYERLQSYERKVDAQMRLQELLGYCAASATRLAFDRLRVIILSREKLRWDALYDEADWGLHWRQYLLNGLAESDAREYLGRSSPSLYHGCGVNQLAVSQPLDLDKSMSSPWVKTEIAKARQKEVAQGRRVLFPIALVPFNDELE